MNKRLLYLFLFISIFYEQKTHSNIVSAERWDLSEEGKVPSACLGLKTIYLFSDYHKEHKTNRGQLKELVHFLRKKLADVSLIVEDSGTFNNCELSWCLLSECIKKYGLPLKGVASIARHCGILATSVECRPRISPVNSQVCIADIINVTNDRVEEISEYDDGSILNEEYRKYVNKYKNKVVPVVTELFKNISAQNCSIKNVDYDLLEYPARADDIFDVYEPSYDLENCDKKERVREVITCYAQEVIDFKILHALVEHAQMEIDTAVIYAGGYHISAIKPILEKLGYHFSKYPTINYDEDGEIQPLNVAQAFQEMDPNYNPDEVLPKETIDYFFEYKEAEENNPCFRTRSMMKMFVAAADSLQGYRNWKKECPRLEKALSITLAAGALTALWCVIKMYCKAK